MALRMRSPLDGSRGRNSRARRNHRHDRPDWMLVGQMPGKSRIGVVVGRCGDGTRIPRAAGVVAKVRVPDGRLQTGIEGRLEERKFRKNIDVCFWGVETKPVGAKSFNKALPRHSRRRTPSRPSGPVHLFFFFEFLAPVPHTHAHTQKARPPEAQVACHNP